MIGQRERTLARRKQIVTAVILLVCALVALVPQLRNAVIKQTNPLMNVVHGYGADWQKRSENKATLVAANAEVQRLTELSNRLIIDKTEYERLKRENVELKQMVKYQAPEKFRIQACGITAFDVATERKLMTLDCGSQTGVVRGNAVLAPNGILIGTITSSESGHMIVQLLKDPLSRVAAEVSGLEDSQGIVMPVGGGAIALRYLGENLKVDPASIVQTSGLLDQVPAGIPIGTVDTTAKETDTPFQRAIIQTPVDPATLTLVNVLIAL